MTVLELFEKIREELKPSAIPPGQVSVLLFQRDGKVVHVGQVIYREDEKVLYIHSDDDLIEK